MGEVAETGASCSNLSRRHGKARSKGVRDGNCGCVLLAHAPGTAGGGQPPGLGAGGAEDRLGPWRVRGALAEDRAWRKVPLEGSLMRTLAWRNQWRQTSVGLEYRVCVDRVHRGDIDRRERLLFPGALLSLQTIGAKCLYWHKVNTGLGTIYKYTVQFCSSKKWRCMQIYPSPFSIATEHI